jgi:phosphate transport system substrate-binding protein
MFRKSILLVFISLVIVLSACGAGKDAINVVSRESGSGTRGAFIELFGIEEKNSFGNKIDKTTVEAVVLSGTQQVMSYIAGDVNSIGYISLGSLNDTVKAVKIDGVEATVENIKNGKYKVARPFNIATKGELSDATQDFINFILSEDGQKVVEDAGYISKENIGPFTSSNPDGKVVISGSSSVTPVMEKLKEAYLKINSKVEIEVQLTDSTSGMNSVMEGVCDIGMASRELKDSEKEKLDSYVIAMDGIAVIVNKGNSIDELSSDQVKKIFIGDITSWDDVK